MNGIQGMADAFAASKKRGEAALIPYICGGYETAEMTVKILLAMQEGGAAIIELGAPCRDPFADGDTIRSSHGVAMSNGTTGVRDVLRIVKTARENGLTVPIVIMGYYSFFQEEYDFDLKMMCHEAEECGANGFLAVGIDEGKQELEFNAICYEHNLTSISIILPGATEERITDLACMASTWLYVVSSKGKTGARTSLPPGLNDTIARIRAQTKLPLCVGFGISSQEMVSDISNLCDGAIVGSWLTDCLNKSKDGETKEGVMLSKVSWLHGGSKQTDIPSNQAGEFSQVPLHIADEELDQTKLNIAKLAGMSRGPRKSATSFAPGSVVARASIARLSVATKRSTWTRGSVFNIDGTDADVQIGGEDTPSKKNAGRMTINEGIDE